MALSSPAISGTLAWFEDRDHRLMHRVNRWQPPRWLRLWMVAATRGGNGWIWAAAGLLVELLGGEKRTDAVRCASLAAAGGVACFLQLKRTFKRRRPTVLAPHAWYRLLPPDQFSFPSGHTITAFAVAVPLGSFYPEMSWGLYFCAASVAASRIILGMHFLSDVLVGICIGTTLGLISVAGSL